MDIIRSFISLFNRSSESSARSNIVDLSIPVCYYGHTYVAQPNSDELARASFILESRNKNTGKNFNYLLSCYNEGTIILRDRSRQAIHKFEIRKIVVSCVDAKHQRHFAVFYDNDSSESTMGMECHLFLCRTKMVAKMAADKIGNKLNRIKPNENLSDLSSVKLDQMNIMTRPTVCDFDYENISKFFREEVFNLSVQDPSSESSSTYLTTGCDSGRASTVASIDTKSEEIGREIINPIREDDECEPEVNMLESSHKLNPRVRKLSSESHMLNHDTCRSNKSLTKNTETSALPNLSNPLEPLCDRENSGTVTQMTNRHSDGYALRNSRGSTNNTNTKYCTERYSHQYELMGVNREVNNNGYKEKPNVVNNFNTCVIGRQIDSKSERKSVKCDHSTSESGHQSIQNRYSVHYDQQDDLLFNNNEDEALECEKENDTNHLLDFSELLLDRNLRKIDKRELHRLTYLSATDI